MSGATPYSYPRIDDAHKQYYVRLAQEPDRRELRSELVVPRLGGKAFLVEKGQILRVTCIEGPQVADFNAFNRDDPKEMFWSGRTRLLQRAHLSVGDRLWSTPPRMRPMFTIIADTVAHQPLPGNARSHDLMYCRCNERLYEVVKGQTRAPNCNSNLAAAIAEFGLPPESVHDAFNIFMTTGLGPDDRFFYVDPDAKKGDYLELHAEMDCIVAISACPGASSGPEKRPIGIRIYQPLR
ncbi:MAG TPA: urea carboxylase-associated family protein [Xanthobacteraceae bacterium]|jgi:hypothetical protein